MMWLMCAVLSVCMFLIRRRCPRRCPWLEALPRMLAIPCGQCPSSASWECVQRCLRTCGRAAGEGGALGGRLGFSFHIHIWNRQRTFDKVSAGGARRASYENNVTINKTFINKALGFFFKYTFGTCREHSTKFRPVAPVGHRTRIL